MDGTKYILLYFIAFKGLDCSLDGNGCDVRKPHKYYSNDFMEFASNVNFDLHNTFRLSNSHHDVSGKTKKKICISVTDVLAFLKTNFMVTFICVYCKTLKIRTSFFTKYSII